MTFTNCGLTEWEFYSLMSMQECTHQNASTHLKPIAWLRINGGEYFLLGQLVKQLLKEGCANWCTYTREDRQELLVLSFSEYVPSSTKQCTRCFASTKEESYFNFCWIIWSSSLLSLALACTPITNIGYNRYFHFECDLTITRFNGSNLSNFKESLLEKAKRKPLRLENL